MTDNLENTRNAMQNISETINEKDWSSSWGVETGTYERTDYKGALVGGINEAGNTALNLAAGIADIAGDAVGVFELSQYDAVADAASAAALNYVNKKIERIRQAFTTSEQVTIKSLLQEVSPYATSPSDAFKALGSRVVSLVSYLTDAKADSWGELAKYLGKETIDTMLKDPAVTSAVSNLKGVQIYAKTVTTITNAIDGVSRVVKKIEPLLPILEIAYEIAASWCTGGASAGKATQDTVELGMTAVQKAFSLSLQAARKYIYNIKIKVPSLLVGALNSISVREAVAGYSTDNAWLNAIFSEEFYNTAKNSLTWQTSINQSLNSINSSFVNVQRQIVSVPYAGSLLQAGADLYLSRNPVTQLEITEASDFGIAMKERFLNSLTKNFMDIAIDAAKRKARIRSYADDFKWTTVGDLSDIDTIGGSSRESSYASDLDVQIAHNNLSNSPISTDNREKSILTLSSNLYESISSNELQRSYSDYAMHKLIVDALRDDGCDCNSIRKEYNEQITYEGGFGSRKSFNLFNDRIIEYHSLLKILKGEQRSNIREAIPVIDFYRPENTSILSTYYTDEKNNIDPTRILPISSPINDVTDDSLYYIENEDPYIINRAVMGGSLAEHFWNTSAPTVKNPNLQVTSWKDVSGMTAWIYKGIRTKTVYVNNEPLPSYKTSDCYFIFGTSLYIDFNPVGTFPRSDGICEAVTVKDGLCYRSEDDDDSYYLNIGATDAVLILPRTTSSNEDTKIIVFKNDQPDLPWNVDPDNPEVSLPTAEELNADISYKFTPYFVEVASFTITEAIASTKFGEKLPDIVQNSTIQDIVSHYILIEKEYYTEASGLLCGLYCEPKEKEHLFSGDIVNKWKLLNDVDLALSRGAIIDIGTKYFSGHILGRGFIRESPFGCTNSDWETANAIEGRKRWGQGSVDLDSFKAEYPGKATIVYKLISKATEDLVNRFLKDSVTTWTKKAGAYPLGCLTTKADYNKDLIREPELEEMLGTKNRSTAILKYAEKLKTGSKKDLSIADLYTYFDSCSDCLSLRTDEGHAGEYELSLSTNSSYVCYKKVTRENATFLNFGWATKDTNTEPPGDRQNTLDSDYRKIFYLSFIDYWKYKHKEHIGNFQNVSIKVASPIDVFDKKENASGKFGHDTILVYPEYNKNFPQTLFLLSRKDLGLEAFDATKEATNSLCNFYNVEAGKVVCFKVDRVSKFLLSKVTKINLRDYKTGERKVIDNIILPSLWGWTFGNYDCYIYYLSAVELVLNTKIYNWEDETLDLTSALSSAQIIPMAYSIADPYFPVKVETSSDGDIKYIVDSTHRYKDVEILKNSYIIPGLPKVSAYSKYTDISISNISLTIFAAFFGTGLNKLKENLLQKALSTILSEWPLSTSEINPIRFKDLNNVLSGLLELGDSLNNLVASKFKLPVSHILKELIPGQTVSGLVGHANNARYYEVAAGTRIDYFDASGNFTSKPEGFEYDYVVEDVEISEEDILGFKQVTEQSKNILLNHYSVSFSSRDRTTYSEKKLADYVSKVGTNRINVKEKANVSTLRYSLKEFKNKYDAIFERGTKVTEEKCRALDLILGSDTAPFIKLGGTLINANSSRNAEIPSSLISDTQLILDHIISYILEVDTKIKNKIQQDLKTKTAEVTAKYSEYMKRSTDARLRLDLYMKYHGGNIPDWFEPTERQIEEYGNPPTSVSEYYILPDDSAGTYITAGNVYAYEDEDEEIGYYESPFEGSHRYLSPQPYRIPILEEDDVADNEVTVTDADYKYVKENLGYVLPSKYYAYTETWYEKSLSAVKKDPKFIEATREYVKNKIRVEFRAITSGATVSQYIKTYFPESTTSLTVPDPVYLERDIVEDFYAKEGRATVNVVETASGKQFNLIIKYPEYDYSGGDEEKIACVTLKESNKSYTKSFSKIVVDDDVSVDLLEAVASFIKTCLEGTGDSSYYVKYVDGDDSVTGRENSLYYKRYKMLNNRLNKIKGPLSSAARYLSNRNDVKKIVEYDNNLIDSFEDFLEITPISSMEELTYLPSQEATATTVPLEGKFYSKKVLDSLKSEINSKCVLTCHHCLVKDSCPFYNKEEVIKTYVPAIETIDLWIKDNKLDLIAHEIDKDGNYISPILTCVESTSNEDTDTNTTITLDPMEFEKIHRPFADIEVDSEDYKIRNLEKLRNDLAERASVNFSKTPADNRDNLGWLINGRYGTVQVNAIKDFENEAYPNIQEQLPQYTYLYDAVFIKDEESYITYGPSQNEYDVSVSLMSYGNKRLYKGKVRVQIPNGLNIFKNAATTDDIYLVSDDTTDQDGSDIFPVIYICPVNEFKYTFDLQDTGNAEAIDPEDSTIYAKDVAQWCANYIKGTCMEDPIGSHADINLDRDQYWMETIQKWVVDEETGFVGWREFPGRPRETATYSEAVVDEDTFDEVLSIAGKPSVLTYQNFIRKMSISMDCVKWIKGADKDDPRIEERKRTLPLMRTNLRLVIVHNY